MLKGLGDSTHDPGDPNIGVCRGSGIEKHDGCPSVS